MVNERIQQYTTELLFQQEQQECLQEGITMETVHSPACEPAIVDFFFQVQKDRQRKENKLAANERYRERSV